MADVLERPHEPQPDELLRRPAGDIVTGERDAARGEGHEARDSIHEGRLAGSVRADQAHDLPLLERQVDAVDGSDALEVDVDAPPRPTSRAPSRRQLSSCAQLLDWIGYLTFTGMPEHGLPSPMLGIDLTAWVPICLSLPFVHCSIEYAAGCGRWHLAVSFIRLPK